MNKSYNALSFSSFKQGLPRVTIIPLFILAGSNAQLEIPIKATLSLHSTISLSSDSTISLSLHCTISLSLRSTIY